MYSHESALFLVWHRYFIHIYEKALKEQCNYSGHLTYWDWTLDWENVTQSPVWDNDLGFGGNGVAIPDSPTAISGGCVADGPFAGLQVQYYNETYGPHCLSRGFAPEKQLKKLSHLMKPLSLERVLRASTYEKFLLGLELGPHNAIPLSIQGDFGFFTAPADPVFFLHHTQLDRLWWKWQQENPRQRLMEYNGKAEFGMDREASLDDLMLMGGLAPDLKVFEFMDTESNSLCYKY
jgi:tyrosinase